MIALESNSGQIPDQGRFADHPEGGQTSQYKRVRQE
jgi:hypothetical protein